MTLGIYLGASVGDAVSDAGEFTKPFPLTFDGRFGGTKETRLYVRNDSSAHYYTTINLKPEDASASPIIADVAGGYTWKLSLGDTQPTLQDWANIAAGNTIVFTDIGASSSPDTSTFLPFWVRVEIPAGLGVQTISQVQLVLRGEENLV